ncbi:hypothetical protein OIU85_020603 [Salix viminalis]|uniref:Endonuclease/exonuclease/phosphatase domain-containing protein n=1 Tax=Salix viminalis TaxID=40686 RepID=A0A9Q0UH20_SALVM|nr:hypothetical protein OIU85_020603 [Salix viminalis]
MVTTIGAWNIRGLNSPNKKKMIQQWVNKNNLNIFGILEPRILPANMAATEEGLGLHNWHFISNIHHSRLCRIMVGWNPAKVMVSTVHMDNQWSANNTSIPWTMMGDFNAIMDLIQLPVQGLHFTWHNNQIGDATILRKLDWAFGNQNFIMKWPLSTATFQTRVASDHSPIIVSLLPSPPHQKSKFRFLNLWTRQEGYEEMVQAAWNSEAYGNPISRLTMKLRTLKGVLSNFHRTHSTNISDRGSSQTGERAMPAL